jgi:hypothetical protein
MRCVLGGVPRAKALMFEQVYRGLKPAATPEGGRVGFSSLLSQSHADRKRSGKDFSVCWSVWMTLQPTSRKQDVGHRSEWGRDWVDWRDERAD